MKVSHLSTNYPELYNVGVSLKGEHIEAILQAQSNLPDFFEIHAENYFNTGGANHALLRRIRELFSISVHGTGLGLGNECGIDEEHLKHFHRVIRQYQPALVSEHLCFTQAFVKGKKVHAGDLLPVVRNEETLNVFIRNIEKVQECIGQKILVENICHYYESPQHDMEETEFLNELCKRSGCGLLVDLNNVYVNGINFSAEGGLIFAKKWLSKINSSYIGEYHVAGSSEFKVNEFVIDDHGKEVNEDVWELLRYSSEDLVLAPTLVEWDTQLPSWQAFSNQVHKARRVLQETFRR